MDCHGNMLAVGGVGQVTKRYPWVDLPLCQSCHTGDALNNYDGQLVRRTAYADSPDIATFIVPSNKRFAETPANPGYMGSMDLSSIETVWATGGWPASRVTGALMQNGRHRNRTTTWPLKDPGTRRDDY